MKFIVERTNGLSFGDEEGPCEEATKEAGEWVVEIADLDGLLAFEEKHGQVIVMEAQGRQRHVAEYKIEIYDGFRE